MMHDYDPAPAAQPGFQLLELVLIHRGALVARAKLQMPSGLSVLCNVLRSRKDASQLFVAPVAEKSASGYTAVIDFATPAVRDSWQAAAIAALRPRWTELIQPPTPSPEVPYGFAPF